MLKNTSIKLKHADKHRNIFVYLNNSLFITKFVENN